MPNKIMDLSSYPMGANQFLNEASRKACCRDDFTRQIIYQRYLDSVQRYLRGQDAEVATDFLSSAIKKLVF
jgi:hypothetical protein